MIFIGLMDRVKGRDLIDIPLETGLLLPDNRIMGKRLSILSGADPRLHEGLSFGFHISGEVHG